MNISSSNRTGTGRSRIASAGSRRQRGVTLVETSVVAAVVATVGHLAVPQFDRMAERQRVAGTAAQIETDLQFMRSEAVSRNRPLRIDFSGSGGAAASCYVIHTGAAGDCSCDAQGQAVCRAGVEELKTVHHPAGGGLSMTSNSRSMLVDPARGTFTPTGSIEVRAPSGAALRVIVNLLGRVRACSASAMPGYAGC